jgi:hypothetical protein
MFTAQYQGQEMYRLARQSLRVDELYSEVATEVRATDELLAQQATEMLNLQLGKIQVVGLVLALTGISVATLAALFALLAVEPAPSGRPTSRSRINWLANFLANVRPSRDGIDPLTSGLAALGADVALVIGLGLVCLLVWRLGRRLL